MMLTILEAAWVVLVACALFGGAYVIAIPVAAWIRKSGYRQVRDVPEEALPKAIVIVPAHNMEAFVGRCVVSLRSARYDRSKLDVVVVADHCTDATAVRAMEAGAAVLDRQEGERGKTYAIAWALETLEQRGVIAEMYVIVDATVRVHASFLVALAARHRSGADIVISHPLVDQENQQWFAQCQGLTLAHRSLQNWARERLGLSVFVGGRGMAYSRSYIERFGWSLALPTSQSGSHPTEDYRHGIRAVERGYRAIFADDAKVYTPLRSSLRAATQQGIRWEQGRTINAITESPRLLLAALKERNAVKFFAALDGMQPPVAILIGLSLALAGPSVFFFENSSFRILGLAPLGVVGLYAAVVVAQGRRDGIKLGTALWAPAYIAWRCTAFVLALVKTKASVRLDK